MIIVSCLMWDKKSSHLDPQMERRPFVTYSLLLLHFALFLFQIVFSKDSLQHSASADPSLFFKV